MSLNVILLISSLAGCIVGLFLIVHIGARQTRETWGNIPDRLEDDNNERKL